MKRTTIYLPEAMKARLEQVARERDLTEAELIRRGVSAILGAAERPAPRLPLFDSGGALDAARAGEMLAGDAKSGLPGFGDD